jgi:hypothetical protein
VENLQISDSGHLGVSIDMVNRSADGTILPVHVTILTESTADVPV